MNAAGVASAIKAVDTIPTHCKQRRMSIEVAESLTDAASRKSLEDLGNTLESWVVERTGR